MSLGYLKVHVYHHSDTLNAPVGLPTIPLEKIPFAAGLLTIVASTTPLEHQGAAARRLLTLLCSSLLDAARWAFPVPVTPVRELT